VQSRVCNLKALNPEVTTDAMRQALKESFEEIYGEFEELDIKILDNQEVKETYDLYSSWEWKFGKSPECETSYRRRFDWGELEIYLKLNAMYISEIMVFSDMLDVELPGMIEKLLLGKRYDCADVDLDKELPECTLQQRQKLREVVDWLAGLRD
jgi:lipoate-protein ligase A